MRYEERKLMMRLYRRGASVADIAAQLGRSRATIYRELDRGGKFEDGRLQYDARRAQRAFYESLGHRGRKPKTTEVN